MTDLIVDILIAFGMKIVLRVPEVENKEKIILLSNGYKVTIEVGRD